ncbi:MAG TPA: PAS domain-containing protein [Alphaproteobacteria bacterium]|nr:PAS domain-containing protein [Alphaproteobacteria bacterium]
MPDPSRLAEFGSRHGAILYVDVVRPGHIRSPQARRLFQWWQAQAEAEGGIPRRAQFDVIEHRALIPDLFLTRVLPCGGFRYELHGERALAVLGRNNRGRPLGALEPRDYYEEVAAYYRGVTSRGRCRQSFGTLGPLGRDHQAFAGIDCPLLDEDGRVGWLIGVIEDCADLAA